MIRRLVEFIYKFINVGSNCLFIGSTDKLAPPLDPDIERDLAIKNMMGDEFARKKLIEHNMRLVVFIAKKYESSGYELEDLVSIGSIGLIKGVNTYKVDKNIKLATYVSRCIANEILMFIRKNKKSKCEVSLEETLNYDAEGNTLALEDIVGTDEDLVLESTTNKENINILSKELNKLNNREKQIMCMRYGLNNTKEYTQKEVASILGISQSYISRIEKSIIRKIKATIL